MDDCTRVLLYGTFDGFTYSTDDLPRITVVLDGGEIVEVPRECVVSADQMVNKYKIRLKDVIERIEKFDIGTKAVWINEILNKLGSEYGFHKYYAGYKQGKFDSTMEREKVTVQQFVGDFIAEQKKLGHTLSYSIDACMSDIVAEWYWDNPELFARAWLDGYTVEEEKQYYVRFKFIEDSYSYLTLIKHLDAWTLHSITLDKKFRTKHTKKQLEEAGFGEVFNSTLFEVKEAEEW